MPVDRFWWLRKIVSVRMIILVCIIHFKLLADPVTLWMKFIPEIVTFLVNAPIRSIRTNINRHERMKE